jgi:hypothetical protein
MKRYIKGADKHIQEKVKDMKYGESSKTWKVSDKVTIGWEEILPEPPENDSDFANMELEGISQETLNLFSGTRDLIKMVDDDPNHVFEKLIKRNSFLDHSKEFEKAWEIVKPIVMNLKWKFNRPRPYQLAEVYGYDIKVMESDTHHTPSYPSGHTTYGAIMGLILSEYYPEWNSEIFQQIDLVGRARVSQGVHYPSDNDAAMVLAGALWQDIKHTILGEA